MGIKTLHKLLESITYYTYFADYKNLTALVDVSSWIYKGLYKEIMNLNLTNETNFPTNFYQYTDYVVSKI